MAAVNRKQLPAAPSTGASAGVEDPKFEWVEKAGSYVLRLALPGFKKDDFRVQVDGAGKLTVRGTRTGAATGVQSSFDKVFQLPSAANLDNIAGRFEAGVLTLTVTKRAASSTTAPTSIEEIKRKLPGVATPKETKPKEEEITKEDSPKKKPMDEATKKTRQQEKQEEDASKSKREQQKPAPAEVKKEEVKPKVPQAPATAPPQVPAPVKKEEDTKQKAPQAAVATAPPQPEKPGPKPEPATGIAKAKAAVAPESLAERVRRQSEEEQRAKAAATDKEAKAEQEKKAEAAACINGWKERAMGELKGLTNMKWAEGITNMKWADGLVETARNNKEVVAVGIAAFSVGFLLSQKLFRK